MNKRPRKLKPGVCEVINLDEILPGAGAWAWLDLDLLSEKERRELHSSGVNPLSGNPADNR